MPQYVAKVRTDMPPDVAFAYMSDLRNFEEWDPGVEAVSQVEGNGPGANAVYDVSVSAKMVTMTFRYTTTDYDPPRRLRGCTERGACSSPLTSSKSHRQTKDPSSRTTPR